ncbi:flagellin, partial [bacterium]|nr:flagellin [bacterium]
MSTRINHNLLSLTGQRAIWASQNDLDSAVQRLSSGLRINYAWDDPTGLGISERLRSTIVGQQEAEKNANYNVNALQTAEGSLGVIDEKLIRMRAIAVQASNGVLTSLDRQVANVEFQQLKSEVDRIARTSNYNGFYLLDGSRANATA